MYFLNFFICEIITFQPLFAISTSGFSRMCNAYSDNDAQDLYINVISHLYFQILHSMTHRV